jgi:hemin uptake protein HemP
LEPTTQRSAPAATDNVKRVTSEALLGSKKELVIVHAGREYRLRLTQNGKLILTA